MYRTLCILLCDSSGRPPISVSSEKRLTARVNRRHDVTGREFHRYGIIGRPAHLISMDLFRSKPSHFAVDRNV